MIRSIIAAMTPDRVIGRDNGLPWRLSADLRRFKRLTMGHALIMGRRTFESIGRPLPGRRTIVVSRRGGRPPDGVELAASLEDAFQLAGEDDECFVAGGAEVYRQALPLVDRMYLTLLDDRFEGDAYFPAFAWADWRVVTEERHPPGGDIGLGHRFVVLERAGRRDGGGAGEPASA